MSTTKVKAPIRVLWLLGALAISPSISAQEYKVKSSSVSAPTKVEVRLPTRALPPQDPRAYANPAAAPSLDGVAETMVRAKASTEAAAAVTAATERIAETTTIAVRGRFPTRFLVLLGILLFVSFLVLLRLASGKRSPPAQPPTEGH